MIAPPTAAEARAHPVLWAMYASEGAWRPARHLWWLSDKVMGLLRGDRRFLAVSMPPGHGKALATDTPIATPRGWVAHGDLRVGDEVFSPSGAPVRVLDNTGAFFDATYEVTFNDGSLIVAGAHHDWDVLTDRDCRRKACGAPGHRHEERLETESLLRGYHRRRPQVPVAGALAREPVGLPVDPYLLGAWLGDGISANSYICAGPQDAPHFAQLGELREDRPGYYLILVRGLQTKLRALGVLKNKHIPAAYLSGSVAQRLALLQGLMDTDGSISTTGQAEFCNTNWALAEAVHELVLSLGYKASMLVERARLYGRDVGPKYRVMFTPDRGTWVFRLERKRARQVTTGTQATRRTITSVDPCPSVPLNCIQVEGGRYLAGRSLIATHNSELLSKYLPTFFLGSNPKGRVIQCSYAESLTLEWSRVGRDILSTHGPTVFGVDVPRRSSAKSWDVWRFDPALGRPRREGYLRAVGRGGSITGKRMDIGVCDDLTKDDREATSLSMREAAWQWFLKVFLTRLTATGKAVVVQTRWHHDDIVGRLLDRQARGLDQDGWEIVNLPAIAEANDPLGRAPGEALWPEMFPLAELERIRARDAHTWSALYQGRPTPTTGALYKREHFRYAKVFADYIEVGARPVPRSNLVAFAVGDLAVVEKAYADYSAFGHFLADTHRGELFLVGLDRGRLDGPELLRRMRVISDSGYAVHVEKTTWHLHLIQVAVSQGIPVRMLEADRDKVARTHPALAVLEAGRLYFAEGAPWLAEVEAELLRFPAGHDDVADVVAYGVRVFNAMCRSAGGGLIDLPPLMRRPAFSQLSRPR